MNKIVAVIPARAGSKGIPNKNIRLVNDKPLIYYAIQNARKSQYISDIIVSTDSELVAAIAKQMGVGCKLRDDRLCGDAVTLDAVIYDAVKDLDYNYVVTMQPTSPTLNAKTLDQAIAYAIGNHIDTVISVINRPHLSWSEKDGRKIPNYQERLNRQYLPPQYLETGAFVISHFDVVSENSRIGGTVDIFEVSENEAIDIDTFADLLYAESVLQSKKIGIYVNGNNIRGTGHIYRVLELADEFFTKPDIYYDKNQTKPEIFGETTHNLIGIDGIGELFSVIAKKQYDIFVNDILTTSIDYMIEIRQALPGAKLINFEDDGEGIYKADLVINALYQNSELPHVKTGEKYYIASKLFMFYEPISIKKKVDKVFISFGGADPQRYSDRLLEIVTHEKYNGIRFVVVLGRAKQNVDELMAFGSRDNIEVLYNVANMPELMSQCDVAVTSRGRTGYELALLGIPTLAMAQNKLEEKHGFVSNENGFTYIGLNPSDLMIEATLDMYVKLSQEERQEFQRKLLSHDLRNGRKRVMGLINSL